MIETIQTIDLRLQNAIWPFAEAHAAEIKRHWADAIAQKPAMFDGRVLGTRSPRVENGTLSGVLIETRFSAFLAWRDWGFPDKAYFNLFGSAVIAGNDGGCIFGIMGDHTSNAGAIYPCGGSLEPDDVGVDGTVDLWGSIARELFEETGLFADAAQHGGDFLVRSGQLLSVNRIYRYDLPVAALARQVEDNLAAQSDPELAGIAVLRRFEDLDLEQSRPYAIATAQHFFGK